MIPVQAGTLIVGALGDRAATLEGVGSWTDVVDGHMHAMTSAGLFGAFTSLSSYLPKPMSLDYMGHIFRGGSKTRMMDYAMRGEANGYSVPTVLLVGTSMSSGKTIAGTLACKVLSSHGLKVIGTKLTGAGRYRDILSFRRAGAAQVYDFVDVGLPSTVVPEDQFRSAIRVLLARALQRRGRDRRTARSYLLHDPQRIRPLCGSWRHGRLRTQAGFRRRSRDEHIRRDRTGLEADRPAFHRHRRSRIGTRVQQVLVQSARSRGRKSLLELAPG
jgi:hypothetical protein